MKRIGPVIVFVSVAALSWIANPQFSFAEDVSAFRVDPYWPKPLPNNWIFGEIGGIAVDRHDHVWVLQRPRSLKDDERGAALTPPISKCCLPAPPVLEFDQSGNLPQAWGGPGR